MCAVLRRPNFFGDERRERKEKKLIHSHKRILRKHSRDEDMPRSVCSSIMSQTTRATSVQQSKPAGAVPPSVLNAAASAEQPAHPSSSSQVGTTKSIPAPAKPPSVAPSSAASAVTTSVAAKSATPSQISGAPSMTSTAALRTRLASLEAKLEVERQERVAASKKIEETQRELDALEKLLKLQP